MVFYSLDNPCLSLMLETALTHRNLKL
jgi:hypothetical protein